MTTTVESIALTLDEMLQKQGEDPFAVTEARLYQADADGLDLRMAHSDPYQAIQEATLAADTIACALVATGWGAPVEPNLPEGFRPSHHPLRVRVRIVVAYNGLDWVTVLRREDSDEVEVINDRGLGDLADALADWWNGELAY